MMTANLEYNGIFQTNVILSEWLSDKDCCNPDLLNLLVYPVVSKSVIRPSAM